MITTHLKLSQFSLPITAFIITMTTNTQRQNLSFSKVIMKQLKWLIIITYYYLYKLCHYLLDWIILYYYQQDILDQSPYR